MMQTTSWVSIVAMLGWLILAMSALASYRLTWRKGIVLALTWAAIFTGVALFIGVVRGVS